MVDLEVKSVPGKLNGPYILSVLMFEFNAKVYFMRVLTLPSQMNDSAT